MYADTKIAQNDRASLHNPLIANRTPAGSLGRFQVSGD